KMADVQKKLRSQVGDYLLAVHDSQKQSDEGKMDGAARERKLDPPTTRRWKKRLGESGKETDPIFAPWFLFAELPGTNFATRAREVTASLASNKLNSAVAKAFAADASPDTLKEV